MTSEKVSKTIAPYGWWDSPITPDLLIQKTISFGEVVVPPNAEDEDIIFVENRPSEAGRAALIHTRYRELKDATDLTQGKYNARTGIHEYGGGAAAALADGSILFSDYDPKSFNVLRTKLDGSNSPQVVTPENPVHRFGDFGPHPTNPNLALTILEDHTIDEPSKVVNSLACIDMSTSPATISTLMVGNNTPGARYNRAVGAGRDFYTFPRFSPNGKYVAWVSWDHPSMPFWATELWVARFEYEEGFPPRIFGSKKISVGATGKDEVLQQPVWGIPRDANSSTSELFFTSDNTNFNNLYSVTVDLQDSTVSVSTPKSVLPEPVPRDFSEPAWVCNNSDYVPLTPDMLVVTATRGGRSELGLINLRRPRLISLKSPFVTVSQLRRLSPTSFVLVAGRSDEPPALVTVDLRGLAQNGYEIGDSNVKVIKRTSDLVHEGTLTKDWLSRAEEIEFPTTLPDGSASTSHALVFPPCNPHFTAPSGSAPPCMVTVHGGPTSASSAALSLSTQFWTTRGWMVCAVNYGGSTGYGRDFMERLNGQWGVVDVRDVVAAAEYLGSAGSAKPFGSLKASEATKLRTDLAQVRAERSALTEQVHDNNAIEFTLRNTAPVWSWKDAVFGLTAAAAAAAAAPAGLLLSGGVALAWLVKRARRVESESVTAIPGVGLQLSTTRALRLSASFSTLTTRSTRLIPRDDLLDLHVAEGFRLWSVFDYLSLVKRDGSIRKLFPNLPPRLPIVQRIYRRLYPALFERSGAPPAHKIGGVPRADPNSIVISGGSAGGYTVLASLCLYPHAFSAGTSRYGVCELSMLASDSHKFESQYLYRLIGGTPTEVPDIYHDRSPLYMADRIRSPVLVLQGSIDKVVPPNQSERIVDEIKSRGGRVQYILFEGEGHGFRQAKNQKRALEAELAWYRDVLA